MDEWTDLDWAYSGIFGEDPDLSPSDDLAVLLDYHEGSADR
ncbi:hypothetical protein [Nocardioides sp. SYSU DS0651]